MIIYASSSTGTSSPMPFNAPVQKVAVQPSGTATFSLQGSINGSDWTDVLASSTYAAGVLVDSTGAFLCSQVRAVFTAVGSTDFRLDIVGV